MHTEEATRAAKTEAVFREVNERIAESAEKFQADEAAFVCECSDAACTDRIDAPLVEYEDVRADGATFMVAPGHEDGDIERVVRGEPAFRVVRKVGAVGVLARRLNPRATTA